MQRVTPLRQRRFRQQPHLQFIRRIPVEQSQFANHRRHLMIHSLGAVGRQFQHRLYLPPRRVVTNGHAGGEVDSLLRVTGAEIGDFTADHHRVRQGDNIVFAGQDFGRQHADLADLAFVIGDADPVAFMQRAGINQHQSAHGVIHHPR